MACHKDQLWSAEIQPGKRTLLSRCFCKSQGEAKKARICHCIRQFKRTSLTSIGCISEGSSAVETDFGLEMTHYYREGRGLEKSAGTIWGLETSFPLMMSPHKPKASGCFLGGIYLKETIKCEGKGNKGAKFKEISLSLSPTNN